jgi:hypothetical protein
MAGGGVRGQTEFAMGDKFFLCHLRWRRMLLRGHSYRCTRSG